MLQHDPRLFFQIAAGLIPALVFGGLIYGKLTPPRIPRGWWWVAFFMVPLVGLTVLQAEVLAIHTALVGNPSASTTWLVSLVLVGLTAGALALIVFPWLRVLREATRPPKVATIVFEVVAGVLLLLLLVQAADLLKSAVDFEDTSQRLDATLAEAAKADTEAAKVDRTGRFLDAYDRMYQTRAAAGLVSKAEARNVHVCLRDRAFVVALQGLVNSVAPDSKQLPAADAKLLVPGKRIKCRGVVAIPPLPGETP